MFHKWQIASAIFNFSLFSEFMQNYARIQMRTHNMARLRAIEITPSGVKWPDIREAILIAQENCVDMSRTLGGDQRWQ